MNSQEMKPEIAVDGRSYKKKDLKRIEKMLKKLGIKYTIIYPDDCEGST